MGAAHLSSTWTLHVCEQYSAGAPEPHPPEQYLSSSSSGSYCMLSDVVNGPAATTMDRGSSGEALLLAAAVGGVCSCCLAAAAAAAAAAGAAGTCVTRRCAMKTLPVGLSPLTHTIWRARKGGGGLWVPCRCKQAGVSPPPLPSLSSHRDAHFTQSDPKSRKAWAPPPPASFAPQDKNSPHLAGEDAERGQL